MRKVKVYVKPKSGDSFTIVGCNMLELVVEGAALLRVEKKDGMDLRPRKVPMPRELEQIGNYAFRGLDGLKEVAFHDMSYKMGAGVFADCCDLETAAFAGDMEKVPMETFSGCRKLRSVDLPERVKRINMDAFKNCLSLKRITFPGSLETIEAYGFWGCRALESVVLQESLVELGDDCFASCTGLKSVFLPDSLRSIGSCAFMNCSGLEEVTVPKGVRELPLGVFANCGNLRRIVLPETLEAIHPYALYQCGQLEYVEHPDVERFRSALEHTPFWRKKEPDSVGKQQFPMELLNQISGPVSGAMLSAMGYSWFETDREYRFFLTEEPGTVEVRCRYQDGTGSNESVTECWLADGRLEPVVKEPPTERRSR